jgi:transposase-like protein
MNESNVPENLIEAVRYFADPEACHEFMVRMRWSDGKVTCPRCGSHNVGIFSRPRMVSNCKACRKQFTVKVGTIFEDSPLSLTKWLPATWMICNAKNGVSSCELARSINVTQKTAWFMLHRIRKAMAEGSFNKMGGQVESDETFIGGRDRFRHKAKKHIVSGWKGKSPVQGLLERTAGGKASRVKLLRLKTTRNHEVQGNVREYVLKGSELHTDALRSYIGMNADYVHQVIDHAICYAKGHVHTNGLENFWCLLKRTLKGTYVNVEPFHLKAYLDEQAFRFNERKDDDAGRFVKALSSIVGRGIRYVELIGKSGGQELQTTPA